MKWNLRSGQKAGRVNFTRLDINLWKGKVNFFGFVLKLLSAITIKIKIMEYIFFGVVFKRNFTKPHQPQKNHKYINEGKDEKNWPFFFFRVTAHVSPAKYFSVRAFGTKLHGRYLTAYFCVRLYRFPYSLNWIPIFFSYYFTLFHAFLSIKTKSF